MEGLAGRILRDVFGFPGFRPNQETICNAASTGRDVLVVMPTGSGKSLCYQMPALVRGGTALVISPLIALMEDQVGKLQARGLRVDRIHSGRARDDARAAFRSYREGKLQFLFVAPERFRVPGFLEALTKQKPSLIAVDEAHCISQWGHDFRPDYRMLQSCVAQLRPTPVIALTATATPAVQRDIVQQLGLEAADLFVQGFRRDNIAIEVVEVPPSERRILVWKILKDPERCPAIIYAPSRKQAEELAAELAPQYRTAAYHAGLDSRRRHEVQDGFLSGKLDIIVATVAFGMGIDKPDVRTVIHVALPGSIEAYYQEIGRAGRDGKPSRAVLMQSYADRHMHDFFFERDYPDVKVLDGLFRLLGQQPIAKGALHERSRLSTEIFESAFEKLWTHSGAVSDWEENIVRGQNNWQGAYEAQRKHRSSQVELLLRFVASAQCRMSALVRYFGDAADKRAWCGICDFCAPEESIAQTFRPPEAWEEDLARCVLDTLRNGMTKATGRLHTETCSVRNVSRNAFEEILGAMARAGLLAIVAETFTKDGREIPYKTARLTAEGTALVESQPLPLLIKMSLLAESAPKRRPEVSRQPKPASARKASPEETVLVKSLRAWRLETAKRKGIPAFRIFSDRTLQELAESQPATEQDLLGIRGIGYKFIEQYGTEILKLTGSDDS